MEEQDELVIPSTEEYSRALHDLRSQFAETDLLVLRELYRCRNNPLPVRVSELAKISGLPTADAANEACFRLSRLLQAELQGQYPGLQVSATSSVYSAPKLHYQWRMDTGLACGMELADLTDGQDLVEPGLFTGCSLIHMIRWLIRVARFSRSPL